MKPIPISEAKALAEKYGYDQVMIYAREVSTSPPGAPPDGGEHMTTYGKTRAHCRAIGQIAKFLQTKIMGWSN